MTYVERANIGQLVQLKPVEPRPSQPPVVICDALALIRTCVI